MLDWLFRQSDAKSKELNMNQIKHNLLAVLLMTAFSAPVTVLAADVTPNPMRSVASDSVDATPAERMQLMQTMRTRMKEMMKTTDPVKRKELMHAQSMDMDALAQMGPLPGMGMMMGPKGNPDCMMNPDRMSYSRHEDARDQRLDSLEKRMDMMQIMLESILRK
jgi:hypothetical protein